MVALFRYADASGAGKDVYDFVRFCNCCYNYGNLFWYPLSTFRLFVLEWLISRLKIVCMLRSWRLVFSTGQKSWQV
jgi:hypothetical protein